MSKSKLASIVLLCGDGLSSRFVYNALKHDYDIQAVFYDEGEGNNTLLKRRIKKLGYWTVFSQLLFMLVNAFSRKLSKSKIARTIYDEGLDSEAIPTEKVVYRGKLSESVVVEQLKKYQCDAIVINGTSILKSALLNATSAPFINTHVGITPKYRGVHGGYWALANNNPEHCGVTVHLVDEGIDTGDIIGQATISVDRKDSFHTYPLKQVAAALPILKQAVLDAANDSLTTKANDLPSKYWSHPTIWQYLFHRIKNGVK